MHERSTTTKWATFACDETEQEFRRENLAADAKMARFLSLVVYCLVASFAFIDFKFQGVTRTFLILIKTRILILVSTAVVFFRMRRAIAPQTLDRWLLGWILFIVGLACYSLSTRTPQQATAMSILILVIISLLVPMRFAFQAGTATATCLALIAITVSKKPADCVLASAVTALTATLVVGLMSSRALQRTRRESFAAHLVERQTVGKLEATLAKVKKLEGILPICAACKKIRQDDGAWVVLEDYISARSVARFSHGLCPSCVPKYS